MYVYVYGYEGLPIIQIIVEIEIGIGIGIDGKHDSACIVQIQYNHHPAGCQSMLPIQRRIG
ncbi:MAG: hypothetical protein PHC78_05335 [Verrucomicrobiota bacterium]|nr:hypothetical protein [Verrucomicrobiota bacterium]